MLIADTLCEICLASLSYVSGDSSITRLDEGRLHHLHAFGPNNLEAIYNHTQKEHCRAAQVAAYST